MTNRQGVKTAVVLTYNYRLFLYLAAMTITAEPNTWLMRVGMTVETLVTRLAVPGPMLKIVNRRIVNIGIGAQNPISVAMAPSACAGQ